MLLLLVSSCSSNEEMPDERLVEKELYDQAQTRLKNGSFSTAIMSLEALESRFPFGRYAEQAQAEESDCVHRLSQVRDCLREEQNEHLLADREQRGDG